MENNVENINDVARIPQKAAGWRRLLSGLIDYLFLSFLFERLFHIYTEEVKYWEYSPALLMTVLIGCNLLLYLSYYIIFEGISKRTLGKLITGTIVLSDNTFQSPNFKQIVIRSLSRLIPFEPLSLLANRPCGWHDTLSRTIVVTIKEKRLFQTESTDVAHIPQKTVWWRRLISNLIDCFFICFLFESLFWDTLQDIRIDHYHRIDFLDYLDHGFNYSYYYYYSHIIEIMCLLLLYLSYYIIFEGISKRTLGKLITGTIVLSDNTFRSPTFKQIVIRSLSRLIPFEALSFLTDRPYGWHDTLSSTIVVPIKEKRLLQTGRVELTMENANFFHRRMLNLKNIGKNGYLYTIIGSIVFPILTFILFKGDPRFDVQKYLWIFLLSSLVFYWGIVFFICWLYANKLKSDQIVVSSILVGILFAIVLGFIFCNYIDHENGIKIVENYFSYYGENKSYYPEHGHSEFNYLLAIASFIIVSGITYLWLKKINEKNTKTKAE
jgi:uncharacterized RDD family membrane protein YckC